MLILYVHCLPASLMPCSAIQENQKRDEEFDRSKVFDLIYLRKMTAIKSESEWNVDEEEEPQAIMIDNGSGDKH